MRTDVSTSASPMQVTNYGLAGMLPIHSLNIYEILSVYNLTAKIGRKILKQVEYESARRKRIINEKTRKRDEEGSTFFLYTFIKGTHGNSRELKRTHLNSFEPLELEGTQGNSSKLI